MVKWRVVWVHKEVAVLGEVSQMIWICKNSQNSHHRAITYRLLDHRAFRKGETGLKVCLSYLSNARQFSDLDDRKCS